MSRAILLSLALWAMLFGLVRVARAEPKTPAGTCDALTFAGYADESDRVEFVIPFREEPACDCAPKPCAMVATPNDASILWPMNKRPALKKPPRVVCWGVR